MLFYHILQKVEEKQSGNKNENVDDCVNGLELFLLRGNKTNG